MSYVDILQTLFLNTQLAHSDVLATSRSIDKLEMYDRIDEIAGRLSLWAEEDSDGDDDCEEELALLDVITEMMEDLQNIEVVRETVRLRKEQQEALRFRQELYEEEMQAKKLAAEANMSAKKAAAEAKAQPTTSKSRRPKIESLRITAPAPLSAGSQFSAEQSVVRTPTSRHRLASSDDDEDDPRTPKPGPSVHAFPEMKTPTMPLNDLSEVGGSAAEPQAYDPLNPGMYQRPRSWAQQFL